MVIQLVSELEKQWSTELIYSKFRIGETINSQWRYNKIHNGDTIEYRVGNTIRFTIKKKDSRIHGK